MRNPLLRRDIGRTAVANGFTLFELLMSISVVVLLLVCVVELLNGTTATITASNKKLDTASLARIALDRFGNDFSGAVLSGGATALYYSETSTSGNSAIAFATSSRARGPTTQTNPWTTDTRAAFIGYRVRPVTQYVGGTTNASVPCLNRGDGRFTLSTSDISANKASFNLWDVFGTGNARIPNDLTVAPSSNDQRVLDWQIIANSIFRLHISFILDDGSIVQTPPSYRNFFVNTSTGTCVAIAFSSFNSADANSRYVKALIVGVAVLDEKTRNLVYNIDNTFWTTIGGKILRPTANGETPAENWNQKLATLTSNNQGDSNYLFPPVRQNIGFYQRLYSVHL